MGRSVARPLPPGDTARVRYEDDLYTWAEQQAAALRAGRLEEVDRSHVAEELTALARSEFAKLVSCLRVLAMHMLKWDQQPEFRTPSWVYSIAEQRRRFRNVIADNPGLKPRQDEALNRAYPEARAWAADETNLSEDEFPSACPYGWDDLLNRPFAIDEAARRPR